ncbi:glycosyltransferase [soil metagenome]
MNRPINIVFLHRGGAQIRGSEQALLAILDGLDPTQFRASVVCSNEAMGVPLEARGIEWHAQQFPELLPSLRHMRLPIVGYVHALRRIIRHCRSRRADIIVSNGGGPCQLGVPAARWTRVPIACLFYHPAPAKYHRYWLTKRVDRTIFASQFTATSTHASAGFAGEVVYVGVDAEQRLRPRPRDDEARARLGFRPEHVVFGQVGALVPHKGHDITIEAFALVARAMESARLVIVGAGPEEARLRVWVEERDLADRIVFTGYVDDTLPFFQSIIDVNVLASHEEGLGLVNLEASACERPNVATDGTGIRETIEHGRTGYLFPDGDVRALAEYMERLGRDDALRQTMGTEGREMVLRRFSSRTYAARVQAILRSVLADHEVGMTPTGHA